MRVSAPSSQDPANRPSISSIDGPEEHGVAGLVHLFGIELPGLTASLSLAQDVVASLVA